MLWFFFALGGAFLVAIYFMEVKKLVSRVDPLIVSGATLFLTGLSFLALSALNGFPEIGEQFLFAVSMSVLLNIATAALYFRALQMTDLSLAIPMLAFTPLFLIFTSSIILGESPHPDGILGILLVVGGSYVLNLNSKHDLLSPFEEIIRNRGMIYMLITALLFSFLANFDKLAMLNSDFMFTPATALTTSGTALLAYSFFRKRPIVESFRKEKRAFALAALALVIATSLTFSAWSLQIVPYVISINRMSVLFSVIFGGVLLKEKGLLKRFAGALLMVLGAAIIVLSS
ncbi:MAG: DMT family transporter [Candidatus Micrarchaeota archaeon]